MKFLFNHPSFYLALPFWGVAALAFCVFNVPEEFIFWILFFPVASIFAVLIDKLVIPRFQLSLKSAFQPVGGLTANQNNAINQFAVLFGVVVLLFCFLDIAVNGLKILNASEYTILSSTGTHIRHISNMCWVLVPIGYFCIKSKKIRFFMVVSAIIFPILFVDRNRLIQSVFCLIWINILFPRKIKISALKYIIAVLVLSGIFVVIGFVRSGAEAFVVPSSGTALVDNEFPLRSWFLEIPIFMQQILLYISAPIFNFATVGNSGFIDPSVLQAQLFSSLGYLSSDDTIPVLVSRFNVGTEFFPFLLYGGATSALLSFFGILAATLMTHVLFLRRPNIFYLLIYLRIIYCCVMSGFAPQFYTWTNFDFVLMCMLFYWACPFFLKKPTPEIYIPS